MIRLQRVTITIVVCVAALLCLLTLGASRASADSFSSTIGTGNSAISGFAGPFAEVTVTLDSATMATITFTSDTVNGNIYLMGSTGAADLNVNAAAFAVPGAPDGDNAGTGFTAPILTPNIGGGTVDGFGPFNLTIDSFDGFTHSSDIIAFELVNESGTWASAADVLTPNAGGFDAGAHIFVTSSPANASNGAAATGFAAETAGTTVTVPEPSSLSLLGLGLLGALGLRRRKPQV